MEIKPIGQNDGYPERKNLKDIPKASLISVWLDSSSANDYKKINLDMSLQDNQLFSQDESSKTIVTNDTAQKVQNSEQKVQENNPKTTLTQKEKETLETLAKAAKKNWENYQKKLADVAQIATTVKSSQGLTYEEASEIMRLGTSGMLVIDEKTGEKREPTDEEALIILKRQADAFPDTKEIYEKFKTAYDAKTELVAKYPELASTPIILEAENPEDKTKQADNSKNKDVETKAKENTTKTELTQKEKKTLETLANAVKKNWENYQKKQADVARIATTVKSSQGLTYNEASEIMSIGTSGMLVIDEKTGEKRKPTDQEALIILKRQADAFPETKEIYEKFKTAYDAKIELVAKYPELASTTIILEAENPEDKNDKKA